MAQRHNTQIHLCKDGSHTVYSNTFRQYFHNPNGAIAESRHVFFETPGWLQQVDSRTPFHLFEVGFGTGLNLLILLEELQKLESRSQLIYHAIDAFPLRLDQAMKLNYPTKLNLSNCSEILASIFRHLQPGLNEIRINSQVTLKLYAQPYEQFSRPDSECSMVIFDPFSPEVSPELWRPEIFQNLASWCTPDALLATYGAASAARAAMVAGGWKVARAPGALGKREMTLAALQADRLSKWQRVNEERLVERLRSGEFAGQ